MFGAEMMIEIQPSYVPHSIGQHYPFAGSKTKYGNMGQAYGAMSQMQDYTVYLNNMSGLNYGNPLSNEGSAELLAVYQKRNVMNGLCSKNESLKSHYSMSCASYNNIFGDLNRAKGLEANLSRKVSALEREKSALRHDLDWVIKKSIPRMLARVFRSKQFDRELVKVQKVFVKRGRELGGQKACDLLMTNQCLLGCDPNLPHKVNDAVIVVRVKGRAVDLQHKKPNPEKVKAIIDMVSPRTIREVFTSTGGSSGFSKVLSDMRPGVVKLAFIGSVAIISFEFYCLIKSGLVISCMNLDTQAFHSSFDMQVFSFEMVHECFSGFSFLLFYAMEFYTIFRSSSGYLVPSYVFTLADIQTRFGKINLWIRSMKGAFASLLYRRDKSFSLMLTFASLTLTSNVPIHSSGTFNFAFFMVRFTIILRNLPSPLAKASDIAQDALSHFFPPLAESTLVDLCSQVQISILCGRFRVPGSQPKKDARRFSLRLESGISTSLLKFPAIKQLAIKRWDEYGFVIHPGGASVRWIYGGVVFGRGNGGVVTVVEAMMVWLWWWREGMAETQILTRCDGDEDGVEMVTVVWQ
nr:hypothetical protein [Tanacetum cinerariifolium]